MFLLPFCSLFWICFCRSSFSPSLVLFSYALMTIFGVILDCFFFFLCISIIDSWLVVTMKFLYSSLYTYLIVLSCCSLNFKCILNTLHLYSPPLTITVLIYFTSNCFRYPLTAYCGYRWYYYFYLSTSLLALCVDDFLPLLYVCLYWWTFSFHNFLFSSCGLFFFA